MTRSELKEKVKEFGLSKLRVRFDVTELLELTVYYEKPKPSQFILKIRLARFQQWLDYSKPHNVSIVYVIR